MSFAGFSHVQPESTQNRKKVRRRSSFLRADAGAIAQVSRYARISGSESEATDRALNRAFSSLVRSVYLPTDAFRPFPVESALRPDRALAFFLGPQPVRTGLHMPSVEAQHPNIVSETGTYMEHDGLACPKTLKIKHIHGGGGGSRNSDPT